MDSVVLTVTPGLTERVGLPAPPGLTVPQGLRGFRGLPERPVPAWLSTPYVFNTDAEMVASDDSVDFTSHGYMTPGIVHVPGTPAIEVANQGVYEISFSVSAVESHQIAVFVNGVPAQETAFGSGAGTQQNNGHAILLLSPGSVLSLHNYGSSGSGITLQSLVGGTEENVNASMMIKKLG